MLMLGLLHRRAVGNGSNNWARLEYAQIVY